MADYYGRLDTRPGKMPSASLQKVWRDQAKKIYDEDGDLIGALRERFVLNYVGTQIADYQEQMRVQSR